MEEIIGLIGIEGTPKEVYPRFIDKLRVRISDKINDILAQLHEQNYGVVKKELEKLKNRLYDSTITPADLYMEVLL